MLPPGQGNAVPPGKERAFPGGGGAGRRRKFEKGLDFGKSSGIITTVLLLGNDTTASAEKPATMEKSPSWSRAHDWKSCRPLKGLEGSNPSFSAMKNPVIARVKGDRELFPQRAA